ncbi:MAG: hypothetical protein Unbinned176contig1000_28 [Prokaryotic dsDNA virus sp.]|nr:MAG: hypothetical protein Unbinned176contig1000_28 [Prokaryotic dsDNA virus sp.]|tara:strand:+ start:17643 stop:18023 length:381 start_codon:yes stop_codon:yes gene_type:complete
MIIKDIKEKDLILMCNDLLFRTVVELNQSKDEKWFLTMSVSLANDLKLDFEKLTFTDIQYAFRQGVRNTDDFVLSVKTFYKWIKAHRQLIWSEASKEPERQDKRLRYRSRNNTGLKSISNFKQLKI